MAILKTEALKKYFRRIYQRLSIQRNYVLENGKLSAAFGLKTWGKCQ
jgi:hypothetical protein